MNTSSGKTQVVPWLRLGLFSGQTLPCGDCHDTPVFSNSPWQGSGETHIVASILHLLQGWWATPPATLAVCQLTYRHRLLVTSSVQCQSNPSLLPAPKISYSVELTSWLLAYLGASLHTSYPYSAEFPPFSTEKDNAPDALSLGS